jgi:hypothetical protein
MIPNNNPLNFGTYAVPVLSFTASANTNSIAQWATSIIRASFQFVVVGTVNGSFQLQVSNDKASGVPPNQFQPSNWSNVGSSVALTSAGPYLIPETEMSYEYLRVVYTDASGATATGTITGRMASKGL